MVRLRGAALAAMLVVQTAPAAAATYGDTLLAATLHRHRDIGRIEIKAAGPDGAPLHSVHGGPAGAAPEAEVALSNALGDPVGRLALRFRGPARRGRAEAIAAELSRHIYTVGVLAEPDPFVPGARRSRRGQALVERLLAGHPGLVTLALHVALPGASNRIVASNFGRIGKPADQDDLHVIADGAVLKEPTNGGRRLAVELPLRDRRGRTIGALSTSFLIGAGGADAAAAEALAVRDALARAIPSLEALAR